MEKDLKPAYVLAALVVVMGAIVWLVERSNKVGLTTPVTATLPNTLSTEYLHLMPIGASLPEINGTSYLASLPKQTNRWYNPNVGAFFGS